LQKRDDCINQVNPAIPKFLISGTKVKPIATIEFAGNMRLALKDSFSLLISLSSTNPHEVHVAS
jgi:hypothetical protein